MDEPIFVPVDPAEILSEILIEFEALTGYAIFPGQPEYSFCTSMAYREVLLRNRINAAGKSQLVSFATYPVLDYLGQLLGVARLAEAKATCNLSFSIIPGHLQVFIPLGTRVASTDGSVIFETIDDLVIPTSMNTVSILATCQTAGKSGNGYAVGTISVIQDPWAFVTAVTNTDITYGGSDAETDSELQERIFLAPSTFSCAGPVGAYKYWARTASPLVIDVGIMTYNEDNSIAKGEVDVYALLSAEGLSTDPKYGGVKEIVQLDILSNLITGEAVTTSGVFIVTLDGIVFSYNVIAHETGNQVCDRIRSAGAAGWTVSGQDSEVYFEKNTIGDCADPTCDAGVTGINFIIYAPKKGKSTATVINDSIEAVLNDENIRPITDIVVVKSPTVINYEITVNIYTTDEATPDLTNRVYTALSDYAAEAGKKMGRNIVTSKIEALSMLTGVYDADATLTINGVASSDNLVIANNAVSHLTGIIINIAPTEDE